MSTTGETTAEPDVIITLSDVPAVTVDPPGTPSGLVDLPSLADQSMDPANSAIQQSGPISNSRKKTPPSAGIAFSGGGIRSAAFCSGALRWMLQKEVPMKYLSCVSGGGYTGAAFLDWQYRLGTGDEWHQEFFEKMRQNAGYMCNWQKPGLAIYQSFKFIFLLLVTVVVLPCLLWLPYALPVAEAVDFLFGDILRESSTCREPVQSSLTSSYLLMELYGDCSPSSRRVALFTLTILPSFVFYILSRSKCCQTYRGHFRFLSILAFLFFAFTAFPWLSHDFLWPAKAWIQVVIFFICLVLPFFFPVIRNYAGIFLFFYAYSYIISWKVFKIELFGKVPYSNAVFYPALIGCGMTFVVFPFLGSMHQTLFNVYYRYSLSNAFFQRPAKFRWRDVFPWFSGVYKGVSNLVRGKGGYHPPDNPDDKNKELTLEDLKALPTEFISNITVNDWKIESRADSSHHLLAFSPKAVQVIGKYVNENGESITPDFHGHFEPRDMRLSSAMAISGAAVSFDMGSFENRLDMVLDLLALLGIGMGDEMGCDHSVENEDEKNRCGGCKKCFPPFLAEIFFCLPLIAIPFVYYLGDNTDLVAGLVVLHMVIVVFLACVAVLNTGSPQQRNACNTRMSAIIRWLITRVFFVRFLRGFLNIPNVGTKLPPVLRLSDGGHFENLALLPLLDKKLKRIVIVDGSCNPGGDKYAEALLTAITTAREKLHCSFEGTDGRDIKEDIRVNFLSKKTNGRLPRHYEFKVHYYDNARQENPCGKGEILFIAPRHPSDSMGPFEEPVTDEPKPQMKPWKDFDVEFGDPLGETWGRKPAERWGIGPGMNKDEVDRLTWCCCLCCHRNVKECKCCCLCCTCSCCCDCCPSNICHSISSSCLGAFPHHITANQFFTPDMFSAYHREGYSACIEAEKFFQIPTTEES